MFKQLLLEIPGNVSVIKAGVSSSAAVVEGRLVIWGLITTTTLMRKPEIVEIGTKVKDVCLGDMMIVSLGENGKVYVLGENKHGQLGVGGAETIHK